MLPSSQCLTVSPPITARKWNGLKMMAPGLKKDGPKGGLVSVWVAIIFNRERPSLIKLCPILEEINIRNHESEFELSRLDTFISVTYDCHEYMKQRALFMQ